MVCVPSEWLGYAVISLSVVTFLAGMVYSFRGSEQQR